MSFIIDKQTLNDLGIFSRNKEISVYGLYNTTSTRGGAQILEEMFYNPLDNEELIRRRSSLISYFRNREQAFPFRPSWFDAAEFYLSDKDSRTRITADDGSIQKKIRKFIKTDTEFQQALNGIRSLVSIICTLDRFTSEMMEDSSVLPSSKELLRIRSIIESEAFSCVLAAEGVQKLEMEQISALDSTLRYDKDKEVRALLDYIYQLDVYISAAKVAKERNFAQAEVVKASENVLEIHGLRHPALNSPVSNDIGISQKNNVIFLTGANMAGKSTFMKAFGIAVFLAHVGFPVPADSMKFSVRDGIYTTINLPDNLNSGYSHFYAEVKRLKKVALCVNTYKNMVIIFDELFRGTNVKDAYDATVAVTKAFADIHESIFMISTHIIEAGEDLRPLCDNISFVYLPTIMENGIPRYTYRLAEGITGDRHGMIIIRNEGILEILNN